MVGLKSFCTLLSLTLATVGVLAEPRRLVERAPSNCVDPSTQNAKLVFAHYMVVSRPPDGRTYQDEIRDAAAAGFDAFALNFGGWENKFDTWKGYVAEMYAAAEAIAKEGSICPFKLFFSMDMTSVTDPKMIVDLVTKYKDSPATLYIDGGGLMLSTFQLTQPKFDRQSAVLDPINAKLSGSKTVSFWPGTLNNNGGMVFADSYMPYSDGQFPWIHHTNTAAEEKKFDEGFAAAAAKSDKQWMAPIAPTFFKHFSSDMNWGNTQDGDIFTTRFQNLLKLKPRFIEAVTWNDWGESSYFGPAMPSRKYQDWAYLDHTGFLQLASHFFDAFKTGNTDVNWSREGVYMFYRIQPWSKAGSKDPLPRPSDANCKDSIFVVTILNKEAQVKLVNGGKETTFTAPRGLKQTEIPFKIGGVQLDASRDGKIFVSKKGMDISSGFELYNGNSFAI